MGPDDLAALERAVVAGVAPREVLEIGDWLVPLDDGPMARGRSAAPIRPDPDLSVLDAVEAAYRGRGLRPAFRIADAEGLAPARAELRRRGYRPVEPTVMKTARAAEAAAFSQSGESQSGELLAAPDAGWAAAFAGEGFDPVEGAARVAILSRAAEAVYGLVREGDETLAVGVASFSHGWAAVGGMRTVACRRGEGLAGRVLGELAREAVRRGIGGMVLQVQADNPARSLYRRAGFRALWTYSTWVEPDRV